MRIDALDLKITADIARASARITWEDAPREPLTIELEVRGAAAPDVRPDPNAFLLAAAIPAMRHGERRLAIEGSICPRLRDGLATAATVLQGWYGPRRLPAIEPDAGFVPPRPGPRRAAAFLSGGMDSLHVHLRNRTRFPPGHPERFAEALHVSGLPYTGPRGSTTYESFVSRGAGAANAVARRLALPLTFIRTNFADIERDFLFFRHEWFGSAFAAIAHLFSRRFTAVAFASAQQMGIRLDPLGSHPLLDPLFSTAALEFRHEGAECTRLQKAETLATRPDLLPDLCVCLRTPLEGPGRNCGRCEKCLHTRIELFLAGAERAAAAFPPGPILPEAIREIPPDPHTLFFWRPLPGPLRDAGRPDLAGAIESKIAEMERTRAWAGDAGWRGRLRRFDRHHLGSALLGWRRAIGRRKAAPSTGGGRA